jgi:hypothetical protein
MPSGTVVSSHIDSSVPFVVRYSNGNEYYKTRKHVA